MFPFGVIHYSSEQSSSETEDLFGEHLASTRAIIKTKKRKERFVQHNRGGALRCSSGLLCLECSLSCYLWLHSLSCSLYLLSCLAILLFQGIYLLFFFSLYELAGIHFKGLLIVMEFSWFGTSLGRGMLIRCFLQLMVCR